MWLAHFNPNHDKLGRFTFSKDATPEDIYKRRAINAAKTKPKVDRIYNSLSKKDKKMLGVEEDNKEWLTIQEGEYVVKRFIEEVGDVPVAALDIMTTNRKGHLTVAIMTDPKYRGQGHAQSLVEKGAKWYDKNKDILGFDSLGWGAYQKNEGSKHIAEKAGFIYNEKKSTKDWAVYDKK